MTTDEIVTDALRELGVLDAADAASGEDATLGLFRLNKLLDNLNAERNGVYATVLSSFTITPSLQPHTIGATGTWVTTQRPQSIESASVLEGDVYRPISLKDAAWYASLINPTLTQAYPIEGWYEPDWPNGKLYLWPIPTSAATVRLGMRTILASLALSDTFTLPPGYQDYLTLKLAIDLSSPFEVSVKPATAQNYLTAERRVMSANARVPRLITRDAGIPGSSGSTFNYETGLSR